MEGFGKHKNNLNRPRVRTTIQYGGAKVSFGPLGADKRTEQQKENTAEMAASPTSQESITSDQEALTKEYLRLYGKLKKVTEQRLEIMQKVDHAREDSILFTDDTGRQEVEKWEAAYKRSGEVESEMEKIIRPKMDELFTQMTQETKDKYLTQNANQTSTTESKEHVEVSQEDLAREYLDLYKTWKTASDKRMSFMTTLDIERKHNSYSADGIDAVEKAQVASDEAGKQLDALSKDIFPKMTDLLSKMTQETKDTYLTIKIDSNGQRVA
jgi:hypothetical protein